MILTLDDIPVVETSSEHIHFRQMSYLEHFRQEFMLEWILIFIGQSSLVHAVIPGLFSGTMAKTTMRIFYKAGVMNGGDSMLCVFPRR